jgi:ribosomal protein S18 acetylase RimI-like enzyme
MHQIGISVVRTPSVELLDAIVALVPPLSASAPVLTLAQLKTIVEGPATHLFIASENDAVVGMLTLVVVQIPTGLRARIEDVVVAESRRSQGIGTALNKAAIDLARSLNVRSIELTSRPSRVEAIRIYERLGFKRRNTNVFSM